MDGKYIRKLRKSLRMTQKELAEAVGVDQVTVNRWENGKRKASKLARRQLVRLANKNG